jgi:CubicO group peptidase (beta-lactamase class C family)
MKNIIIIIALLLLYASCKNEKHQKMSGSSYHNVVAINTINKELDSLYNLAVFNGFTATIVDSTGIVYNKGFGYADVAAKKAYTPKTIINIASVSKMFIGVALAKANDLGLLKLDDPITNYLPFKVMNPHYPQEQITIRQLATHTSSIVDADVYLETCYANKDDVAISEALKRYSTYYQNPSEHQMTLAAYLQKVI